MITSTGTTEALMLALRAVANPGDAVAVESPCYVGILHLLERLQLLAVELPTDPRDGVSIQAIEELAGPSKNKVSAVILSPSVHNSLGGIMSDEKSNASNGRTRVVGRVAFKGRHLQTLRGCLGEKGELRTRFHILSHRSL